MKIIFLTLNLLFVSIAFCQNQNDIIIKHNGEHLKVKVISVDEKITYTFPDESVVIAIGKNCVKEIVFSSGRVQEISEKRIISSEDDWEKVQITTDPEDVRCLVRKGEITASANNAWSFKSKTGVDKKATMKIKKEAAALKAHIILIQDQHKETNFWSDSYSSKSGVAYGYE